MLSSTGLGLLALAGQVLSREMAPDAAKQSLYSSGAMMEQILAQKQVFPSTLSESI